MATFGILDILCGANVSDLQKKFKSARKTLNDFGDSALGMASRLTGLGGIVAGAFAGFSAVAFVKESLKSFSEQEQAMKKTEAVVRSTGGAAGLSAKEMDKFADSLESTTKFAGDVTLTASAIMATFTNIKGDNFKTSMKLAQDMSTVLGTDLQASVIQVSKAMNDTSGYIALKRAGVSFSEQQLQQIEQFKKTGDMAGYQKLILSELSKEFGGAASAAADSFEGRLTILYNRFGRLTEAIGRGLTPVLDHLAVQLTHYFDTIDDRNVTSWVESTAVGLARVADYFTLIRQFTLMWEGGLNVIGGVFETIWSAINKVARAMVELASFGTWDSSVVDAQIAAIDASADAAFANTQKAEDEIEKLSIYLQQGGATAGAEKFFAGIKRCADESAKATAQATKAITSSVDEMIRSTERTISPAMQLISQWKAQSATFDMSGREAAMKTMKGFYTDEQMKELKALHAQITGQEELKKAMDAGLQVYEQTRTPLEQYESKLHELKGLLDSNAISQETYERAVAGATKGFREGQGGDQYKANGGLTFGSQEAHSALMAFRNTKTDPQAQLNDTAKKQLEEQKQATWWLRQLAKATPSLAAYAGI